MMQLRLKNSTTVFAVLLLLWGCEKEVSTGLITPEPKEEEVVERVDSCDNYLPEIKKIWYLENIAPYICEQSETFYTEISRCGTVESRDTFYAYSSIIVGPSAPFFEDVYPVAYGMHILTHYEDNIPDEHFGAKDWLTIGGFQLAVRKYDVIPWSEENGNDYYIGQSFQNLDVDSFYPLKEWFDRSDLPTGHLTISEVDSTDCNCMRGSYEFWLRRTRDDVPVEQREVIRIYDDAFCIDIGDIIYIDNGIED